jgi:hypothetical protein
VDLGSNHCLQTQESQDLARPPPPPDSGDETDYPAPPPPLDSGDETDYLAPPPPPDSGDETDCNGSQASTVSLLTQSPPAQVVSGKRMHIPVKAPRPRLAMKVPRSVDEYIEESGDSSSGDDDTDEEPVLDMAHSQVDDPDVAGSVEQCSVSCDAKNRKHEFQRLKAGDDLLFLDADEEFIMSGRDAKGLPLYGRMAPEVVHDPDGKVVFGKCLPGYFATYGGSTLCACGDSLLRKNGVPNCYEFEIGRAEKAYSTGGALYWYDTVCAGCAKYRYPVTMKYAAKKRRAYNRALARSSEFVARRELAKRACR